MLTRMGTAATGRLAGGAEGRQRLLGGEQGAVVRRVRARQGEQVRERDVGAGERRGEEADEHADGHVAVAAGQRVVGIEADAVRRADLVAYQT